MVTQFADVVPWLETLQEVYCAQLGLHIQIKEDHTTRHTTTEPENHHIDQCGTKRPTCQIHSCEDTIKATVGVSSYFSQIIPIFQ
jgi:hypothetical protein